MTKRSSELERFINQICYDRIWDIVDFDSLLTEEEKNARRKSRCELEKVDPTVTEAKNLHSSIKKAVPRKTKSAQ